MEIKIDIDENEIKEKVIKKVVSDVKKDKDATALVKEIVNREVEKAFRDRNMHNTIYKEAEAIWERMLRTEVRKKVDWNGVDEWANAFYPTIQKVVNDFLLDIKNEDKEDLLLRYIAENIANSYRSNYQRNWALAKELKRICEEVEE